MKQNEVNFVIDQHKKWIKSEGKEGKRAKLRGVDFVGADLRGADLRRADLVGVDLRGADLRGVNFVGASLVGVDFRGARLVGVDLGGVDFVGASLRRVDFRGADLVGVDFVGASLRGVDFVGASLGGVDFVGADLRGADLRRADLVGVDFRRANLVGVDFRGARLVNVKNILSQMKFMNKNFTATKAGYIVYKTFGENYALPKSWVIEPNSIIEEVCNPNRTEDCGCGINVATLKWVKSNHSSPDIWKLLIKWEWAAGIVVPYSTDGKIRCEKAMILEEVRKVKK